MSKPRVARGSVPLKNILQHFLSRIEDKQTASTDCYEQEFQDLKKFSETLKYPCTEGEKEINKKKNRYKDILPFDVTRVVLSCGSDYINANYIKGASGSPAYIASQGPLPNTVADFWRMVVQCQVQVIVMACNPHEAGKHKCENYWVEKEGETKTFGCVEIRLIKASNVCPDFLVRTMLITYTNENHFKESRTVCQFHYLAWPDHGVPTLVRPLLDMVRLVRDTQASETLPVLVHCSAGCGRTGTICAIDFVWGLLRLGKMCEDFNLYDLVREMRRQRVAMVQTKEQYMLVHQAVSELLKQQLSLIQSHHYENLDINGEPIYDTIPNHADEETQVDNSECRKQSNATPIYESIRTDVCKNREKPVPLNFEKLSDPENKKGFTWENGEEKQDGNKIEYYEEYRRSTASRSTPPLPRSKWSSPVSSKQEKEAENMTEKNRIAASLKPIILPDESPDNSLIRRPKIAKLRALFERSSPNSDKKTPKLKASISRSHSLGPIRKPSVSEIIKPVDVVGKGKKSEPAVRSGGKLKVPKLLSAPRTVPQVKRSKSLILNKQSTPFLSLLKEATGEGVFGPSQDGPSTQPFPKESTYEIPGKKPVAQSESSPGHFESHGGFRPINQRRRSLDSITGEESPRITWPNIVQHVPQQSMKPKAAMSLRHQLQVLTNASHRTVTSLASGWSLGIRERRNSFRQAISKDIDQFGTEGRFVYVSEDTKDVTFAAAGVLVDAQNPHSHNSHLTVRAQNGDILPPKNHASNQLWVNLKDGLLPAKTSEDGSERRHNKLTRSGNSPGERSRPTDSRQWRMSSQSMRLPSNNKFLYRLRSELETKTMSRHGPEQKFPFPEQKISSRARETEVNGRGNQATVTGGELQTRDTLTRSANAEGTREEKRRVVPGSDREKHMSEGQVVDRLYKDGLSKGDRFEMPMEVDVTDGVRKTLQYHPREIRDGRDVSALNQSTNRPKVDRGGSRTLPPRISGRVFPPLSHYPSKSSSASSQSSDNLSDYVKVPPIHPVGQSEKRHLRQSQPRMAVSDGLHDERSSRGMTMEGSRESTVPYSKDIKQRMSSDEMLSSGASSVSRGMVKKAIYGRRMYLVEREGSESSSSSGAHELIDHLLTPTTDVSWATLTRSKSSSDALMELKSHHVPPEPRAPPRVRRRSSTATAPPASLGPTSAHSLTPHNRNSSSQLGQLRYTPKHGTMQNMGVDVDAVAASMLSASLTTQPQLLSDPPLTHTSSHNPLTSRKHHYL